MDRGGCTAVSGERCGCAVVGRERRGGWWNIGKKKKEGRGTYGRRSTCVYENLFNKDSTCLFKM